jgi:hypothetical protein
VINVVSMGVVRHAAWVLLDMQHEVVTVVIYV